MSERRQFGGSGPAGGAVCSSRGPGASEDSGRVIAGNLEHGGTITPAEGEEITEPESGIDSDLNGLQYPGDPQATRRRSTTAVSLERPFEGVEDFSASAKTRACNHTSRHDGFDILDCGGQLRRDAVQMPARLQLPRFRAVGSRGALRPGSRRGSIPITGFTR